MSSQPSRLIASIQNGFSILPIVKYDVTQQSTQDCELQIVENFILRRLSDKQKLGTNIATDFRIVLKKIKQNLSKDFNMFDAESQQRLSDDSSFKDKHQQDKCLQWPTFNNAELENMIKQQQLKKKQNSQKMQYNNNEVGILFPLSRDSQSLNRFMLDNQQQRKMINHIPRDVEKHKYYKSFKLQQQQIADEMVSRRKSANEVIRSTLLSQNPKQYQPPRALNSNEFFGGMQVLRMQAQGPKSDASDPYQQLNDWSWKPHTRSSKQNLMDIVNRSSDSDSSSINQQASQTHTLQESCDFNLNLNDQEKLSQSSASAIIENGKVSYDAGQVIIEESKSQSCNINHNNASLYQHSKNSVTSRDSAFQSFKSQYSLQDQKHQESMIQNVSKQ